MHVIDLARATGVPVHVVRYYARMGLLKPRRNPSNHYRDFAAGDVCRLQFIRNARSLGFTLREVRDVLRGAERHDVVGIRMRQQVTNRLADKRRQIEEALPLLRGAEQVVNSWPNQDRSSVHELFQAIATASA